MIQCVKEKKKVGVSSLPFWVVSSIETMLWAFGVPGKKKRSAVEAVIARIPSGRSCEWTRVVEASNILIEPMRPEGSECQCREGSQHDLVDLLDREWEQRHSLDSLVHEPDASGSRLRSGKLMRNGRAIKGVSVACSVVFSMCNESCIFVHRIAKVHLSLGLAWIELTLWARD